MSLIRNHLWEHLFDIYSGFLIWPHSHSLSQMRFLTYNAASHQVVIKMLWLNFFSRAVMSSIFKYNLWFLQIRKTYDSWLYVFYVWEFKHMFWHHLLSSQWAGASHVARHPLASILPLPQTHTPSYSLMLWSNSVPTVPPAREAVRDQFVLYRSRKLKEATRGPITSQWKDG